MPDARSGPSRRSTAAPRRHGAPPALVPALVRAVATAVLAGGLAGVLGCGGEGTPRLLERLGPEPPTPHARYADRLRRAGLDSSMLGRSWLAAADSVLAAPIRVSLPFRERVYFAADEAGAVAYALDVRRGQRVRLWVAPEPADAPAAPVPDVFLDAFALPDDSTGTVERVASADSTGAVVTWDARRDGRLLVRLQPELLAAGSATLTVEAGPSLAFPVAGRDTRAIQSRFGVARDGGRRSHHGVDIFAPRGTPVLAATDGVIRSTEPNRLGGIVVWLRDGARRQSLYYAHLDRHVVQRGQRVRAGDTLGFVGNSGNARTTPPHLHFGIYARGAGPVDPDPFLRAPRRAPRDPLVAAPDRWARPRGARATLYADPSRIPGPRGTVARATPLRVLGATGLLLRVRLPDGRTGYVAGREVEPGAPAGRLTPPAGVAMLRAHPAPGAPALALVEDRALTVLGRFGDYALVRTGEGRTGWVPLPPPAGAG